MAAIAIGAAAAEDGGLTSAPEVTRPPVAIRSNTEAKLLSKEPPDYPLAARKAGQEGWVELSMVIRPDGTVADPVIQASSGNSWFEKAALNSALAARYSPATADGVPVEQCAQKVRYIFAIAGTSTMGARPQFTKQYGIARALADDGRIAELEAQLGAMSSSGSWNLYESVRLALMDAELSRRKQDEEAQLKALERATLLDGRYLEPEAYSQVLVSLFKLQVNLKQYASALETHDRLAALPRPVTEPAIDRAATQIRAAVSGPDPLSFDGVVGYPTGNAEGRPNWQHQLLRRRLTFNDVGGKLSDFEIRCDWKRVSDRVASDKVWTIPDEWGTCAVFVFGAEGSKVQLVELAPT